MLIIVGLAALLILGLVALGVGLPVLLAAACTRGRRRPAAPLEAAANPDWAFAQLIAREWPDELGLAHIPDPPGNRPIG